MLYHHPTSPVFGSREEGPMATQDSPSLYERLDRGTKIFLSLRGSDDGRIKPTCARR